MTIDGWKVAPRWRVAALMRYWRRIFLKIGADRVWAAGDWERPGSGLGSLDWAAWRAAVWQAINRSVWPAWLGPGSNRPEKLQSSAGLGGGWPGPGHGGGTVHPYTGAVRQLARVSRVSWVPAGPGVSCLAALRWAPCLRPGLRLVTASSRCEPRAEQSEHSQTQTAVSRVETDHPAILTTRVMARNPPQPPT